MNQTQKASLLLPAEQRDLICQRSVILDGEEETINYREQLSGRGRTNSDNEEIVNITPIPTSPNQTSNRSARFRIRNSQLNVAPMAPMKSKRFINTEEDNESSIFIDRVKRRIILDSTDGIHPYAMNISS